MKRTKPVGRKIKLLGIVYELIFCSLRYRKYEYGGFCDPPTASKPQILIEQTLKDRKRLEMLIHEMLHAIDWHKDEKSFVAPAARDMARVLYEDGYRRPTNDA